jgi:hypothetical protein
VKVLVLNLDGDKVGDLSSRLDDGQVSIDTTADVTRSATLTLLDPDGSIAFDSDSPSESAMYLDRMIQVIYCVKSELLNDWVEIPIFTGPIVSLSRDDSMVTVECQGKEILAMGAAWNVFNRAKGANVVNVIRDIMADRAGENSFKFPDSITARLDKPFSLSRESVPWLAAKNLAQSIDRQLFYDGSGTLRLRPRDLNSPQWTFNDGNEGDLLTVPNLSFSTEGVKNTVIVNGGAPKGQTKLITVTAQPVDAHPLSAIKLGRNGVPRHLVHIINNPQIRSVARATEIAESTLSRLLRQEVEVAFEAVPIPLIEEGDCVEVVTGGTTVEFNANQFTIPLKTGASMSMGFLDRNRFARNRFRTRTTWRKPKQKKHTAKNKKANNKKNN